ncbi:MAG TPA: MFS transporter [Candidatus Cybelea sp.]|nr:MFS transporter [Candidatus Cybelea sp.]
MWKCFQPVAPVLCAVVLMEGALGVMSPLIGYRLSTTGASTFVVGAAASAYFIGFLLGTLTCQRMIDRVGHIRAFGVFAVTSSNIAILYIVLHEPLFWVALRFFAGYALAGAFVVIESWMTDKSSEENRGQVFAMYTTASWAASGVSPLLLNFDKPGGILLFVLVTIGLSAAMIPLAITKVGNPEIGEHKYLSIAKLFSISPTGVVCAFGSGMMNGGLYGLMPAYIDNHGYGEKELSLLYSITTIAALVTQYPIGWVSDNYGRRPVIIGNMLIAAATALVLYSMPGASFKQLVVLFFILTAFESPLYALAVGQVTDYVERQDFVAASSGLLFAWGLGSCFGPATAGLLMREVGPQGLLLFAAVCFIFVGGFAIVRVLMRRAKTPKEQSDYVAVPMTQATYGAPELDPRSEYRQHPPSPATMAGYIE